MNRIDILDVNGLMVDLSFAMAEEREINDMINKFSLSYLALVISFMKSDKDLVIWN